MADYYPLIARAVAGLEKNTGDGRRALYERARTALVAQLRSVNPPLSENDVTRERLALEESIRKVEAEASRKAWVDPANGGAPTRVRAPEFPRWDPPPSTAPDDDEPPPRPAAEPQPRHAAEPQARQAAQPRNEPLNGGRQAPARPLRASNAAAANAATAPVSNGMLAGERYAEPMFEQPVPPEQASNGARPVTARAPKQQQDRRSLQDAGLKNFRAGVTENGEDHDPLPRVVKNGPLPTSHDFDRIDTRSYDPHGAPMSDFPQMLEQGPDYDDARPLPAKAVRQGGGAAMERVSRRSLGDVVRITFTLLILAGLLGVIVWQWPNMMSIYQSARAPAPPPATTVAGDSQPTKTRSNKVTDRLEQPGQTGAPSAAPSQPPTSTAAAPSGAAALGGATVAQKVVLYEEDPSDPNGRQFVGSAIWRVERLPPPAAGQPEEIAIRADVEIPDRKLTMTWSLRRNTDPSLPASHTVEILFKLPQDFPSGAVTNVPGILMKQTEQTRGAPLAGHAVKVTDSYYLIGLSSFDADRENNLRMLKERGWFDIPVVYSNKRRAILAVEKGTPGDRAFAEAFAAWRQ